MALPFFNKKETDEEFNQAPPPEMLPRHVGFIMDGNGRWAKKRGMPRTAGHREGAQNFQDLTDYCLEIGIQNASFYVFSTENWKRPQNEVDTIMDLLWEYLLKAEEYIDKQARMIFVGDRAPLQQRIQDRMLDLETRSRDFKRMNLILCINYGGRDDIRQAAQRIAVKAATGEIDPAQITEQTISDHLYTAGLADVDFLIRPSGEQRISNYLIWQCAYAEFYYTDVLWPDFKAPQLNKALWAFTKRGRRFGGLSS